MSATLFGLVKYTSLPLNKKLILMVLADHASDEGFCFPSQTTLAQECSLSTRQLRTVLHSLEDDGWFQVLQLGNGRGKRTEYLINVRKFRAESSYGKEEVSIPLSPPLKAEVCDTKAEVCDTKGGSPTLHETSKNHHRETRPRTLASPLLPEEEEAFAKEFFDVPHVRDEIEAIKGKGNYFSSKNKPAEMRRQLNWARDRARTFGPQRNGFSSATAGAVVTKPIPPTSHNPAMALMDERLKREQAARRMAVSK